MTLLRIIQIIVWSLVLVVGGVAGSFYLLNTAKRPGNLASAEKRSSLGYGDYELMDTSGHPFNRQVLDGRYTALFFGFTHCPDVCPTTLAEIAHWYEQLGADGKNLKTYFISVDPERDTLEAMREYLSWNNNVTGVTGTPQQLAATAKAWGVFYKKVPGENGSYTMDHTSAVYLLDRSGQFHSTISYREDSQTALARIRVLLGS